MKILVMEDDERLSAILAQALKTHNHLVETAMDGETGWDVFESSPYDLVVLDVLLPQMNGIQFCQRLRDRGYQTPVLMLTSRDTSQDKVLGLDSGADDYVIKPFDLPELLARVRAMLRRGGSASPLLQWGHIQMDPSNCEVLYRRKPVKLTRKEIALLELLLRNPQQVFSRSVILDRLWTFEDPPNEDAVKALLKRLRQKLVRAGAVPDIIETVYGLGYRMKSRPAD